MTSFDPDDIKRVKVRPIKCPKCKLTEMAKTEGKESGPKGPGFGLPPEGASMVFPRLRQCAGVMEWWSNGIKGMEHRVGGWRSASL
ncbi:MAG: hypothetical protein JSV14_03905 [Deltaproteobacteria bacterium]|nr:MAG: hypothetical protein JSV14_03905 [Deltaproteobacteria bacterium]